MNNVKFVVVVVTAGHSTDLFVKPRHGIRWTGLHRSSYVKESCVIECLLQINKKHRKVVNKKLNVLTYC